MLFVAYTTFNHELLGCSRGWRTFSNKTDHSNRFCFRDRQFLYAARACNFANKPTTTCTTQLLITSKPSSNTRMLRSPIHPCQPRCGGGIHIHSVAHLHFVYAGDELMLLWTSRRLRPLLLLISNTLRLFFSRLERALCNKYVALPFESFGSSNATNERQQKMFYEHNCCHHSKWKTSH